MRAQALSGYELYFAMARGVPGTEALDMSKFFDTNYHYLVPELGASVTPKPDFSILLEKVGPLLRMGGLRACSGNIVRCTMTPSMLFFSIC